MIPHRRGHTEVALELCRLAEMTRVATICEVMGDDGPMLDRAGLERWALRHDLPMISIDDLAGM